MELKTCAAGPRSGHGWLLRSRDGRMDSLSVEISAVASGASEGAVAVREISEFLSDLPRPILMKMDVEGMEDALLHDRKRWIEPVEIMMIEFHGADLERKWVGTLREEEWTATKQFDTWHSLRRSLQSQSISSVGEQRGLG